MKRRMPQIAAALCMLLAAGAAVAEQPPLTRTRVIALPGVEGRIDHMAIDVKGQRLFVAALGNNSVEVVDVGEGKWLRRISGLREPQGVAYLAESDRLVVASAGDGSCRVFDGRTYAPLQNIDCKPDADNVRFDPLAKFLYVGYGDGALAVIDCEKGTRLADIALEGHPESFQLEPQGRRIFVNVPAARHIAIVDWKQKSVVAKWSLPHQQANFPMALDAAHHRLLVGCRQPAKMVVIDTQSGKLVVTLACAGDADDLFYDVAGKRIYVSGGAGEISVFQQAAPDSYQLLANVPSASGARTCLLVAETRTLYLAVPHRGRQPAEVWQWRIADRQNDR